MKKTNRIRLGKLFLALAIIYIINSASFLLSQCQLVSKTVPSAIIKHEYKKADSLAICFNCQYGFYHGERPIKGTNLFSFMLESCKNEIMTKYENEFTSVIEIQNEEEYRQFLDEGGLVYVIRLKTLFPIIIIEESTIAIGWGTGRSGVYMWLFSGFVTIRRY